MSTFAMFWAVVLLGSVSTASAYRSLSFEVDANSYTHNPTFAEWSSENATFVYYSSCEMNFQRDAEPKECIVVRLQEDFSGTSRKEDRCNVKLHPESGGWIDTFYVNIARMGEDRAILSWMEVTDNHGENENYLRFSIVNFSNCKVKTANLPRGIDFKNIIPYYATSYSHNVLSNGIYLEETDDLHVFFFNSMSIDKYSINTEGIVSKVDNSQLTYPLNFPGEAGRLTFPLAEDKGYLLMELAYETQGYVRVTMALIQPNGQRRNLTHYINSDFSKFSLDNGLIGICTQNYTTLKCTQFGPDDEEINWFSTGLIAQPHTPHSMYNLPRDEGFLIFTPFDIDDKHVTPSGKKLVKIGLDGKVKQYVNTDMGCKRQPESYEKMFKDRQGNYCVSFECTKKVEFEDRSITKFQSKCFGPNDFTDI